jgi:hypothetical protein
MQNHCKIPKGGKLDLIRTLKIATKDGLFLVLHEAIGLKFKFAVKDEIDNTVHNFLIGSITGFGTDEEGDLIIFVDTPYFLGKPLHGIAYCTNKNEFYAQIFTVHDIGSLSQHFPEVDVENLLPLLEEYKGKPIKRLIKGEFIAVPQGNNK